MDQKNNFLEFKSDGLYFCWRKIRKYFLIFFIIGRVITAPKFKPPILDIPCIFRNIDLTFTLLSYL